MEQSSLKNIAGKMILFATILASGMAFLDGSVVNIAIPVIQQQLNATIADIQWVVNGYALLLSALILISGALGDRFGRKRIFLYGICVFITSSFICSISQNITQLIIFRAIQGIGGAMMVPGSLSIINVAFKESERGRVIGLWSGFAGGVAALGPFLGGWLVQTFGWPAIFIINIPLGILALLLTIKFVPETKNHEATKIDLPGATTIFLSLLGITYGLIQGPAHGWNTINIASLIIGIIFFVIFIIIEKYEKEPLVPFHIFSKPLVVGSNLVTLFLYFALNGVIFFLILNFEQVQHYSPLMSGIGMLPTILIITFLSGYGGTIADKIGPRVPMILGPLAVAIGMFLLVLPGKNANYFLQFMPGLLLFGLGMAFVIAPLTKSALAVEEKYSGAASGVNNAVARVAALFAVALLGAIIISLFTTRLNQYITTSAMQSSQKQAIMIQQNKLAGIDIPASFSIETKQIAQTAIEDSFIYAFRWVIGMSAFLAFFSAIIAFFTIHNTKNT